MRTCVSECIHIFSTLKLSIYVHAFVHVVFNIQLITCSRIDSQMDLPSIHIHTHTHTMPPARCAAWLGDSENIGQGKRWVSSRQLCSDMEIFPMSNWSKINHRNCGFECWTESLTMQSYRQVITWPIATLLLLITPNLENTKLKNVVKWLIIYPFFLVHKLEKKKRSDIFKEKLYSKICDVFQL